MKYSERRPLRNAYGASPFYDFMARALLEPQEPKRIQSLRKSRQSFGCPECGEKLVQDLTIQETRFYCMRCLRKAKRARAEFDRDLKECRSAFCQSGSGSVTIITAERLPATLGRLARRNQQ